MKSHHAHLNGISRLLAGQETAYVNPPHGIVACPDCGAVQALPAIDGSRGVLRCWRCRNVLERTAGRSIDAALACALAGWLLLFPANILPLLHVSIATVVVQSRMASGVIAVGQQGWPLVAAVVGLEVIVIPFLRFGLLTVVLATLRLGLRPQWLGPAFRWAEWLDEWAMPDVFLFGCIIGYARVAPYLPISIGAGGWSLISVALLTLITRASLEKRAVWRMIYAPETVVHPNMLGCSACDLAVSSATEGKRCPRCGLRLWKGRPHTVMRTTAFTLGALALYPIAYLYPMEKSVRINSLHPYSIMTGVVKLVHANLWFFAAIIFIASIGIPFLKLLVLSWLAWSAQKGRVRHAPLQTRLYRTIVGIGRWSHIDVFTVAVFLPLMHLSGFLSVIVGRALPAFLAVVVLTMLATDTFDPRILWPKRARDHE